MSLNVFFIKRKLNGHISDVNVCRFFPSGLVVLSGGSDLKLKSIIQLETID